MSCKESMKLEWEDKGYISCHVVQVSIEFVSTFYGVNRSVSELILRQCIRPISWKRPTGPFLRALVLHGRNDCSGAKHRIQLVFYA